jgi:ribosomal 30S subunit maturation factor RimM
LIILFEKKRKTLINDYEKLLNLKNWYEKISEEASRSYIIESVEKRGNELINQLNLLNAKLVKIQEHHKNLQERQQELHENLLEEHKLLNQYFENYS